MISYKTYKMINESFFNMGLSQTPTLGIVGSNLQEMGLDKKALMKKPPVMDDELEDEEMIDDEEMMGDELGDEEMMGDELGDEMMGDEFGDEEMMGDEFGDEMMGDEMGEFPPDEGLEDEEMVDDPLMNGEDDGEEMIDDMGDEDLEDEEMVFMKKPMRKHMQHDDLEDEDNPDYYTSGYSDHEDDAMSDLHSDLKSVDGGQHITQLNPNSKEDAAAMDRAERLAKFQKGRRRAGMRKHMGKCCGGKKHMAKENTEYDEFAQSLCEQLSGDQTNTYFSGLKEEILLAMQEPEEKSEPQPGEVGFAPQSKIGDVGGGYTMDDIDLPTLGN